MSVLIETTVGDLVVDLFVKQRPKCCTNFLKLCKIKYYNLNQFHSIEQNYIAQTGDPTGTGRGGDSVFGLLFGEQARYFEPETVPKFRHNRKGLVSMVNNGSGMAGSQFFITLADENLDFLDDKHIIFGQVTEGVETIDALNAQLCDDNNRPFKDIRISHTIILDDPFEDPPRLPIPSRSPSPTMDLLITGQIALDQEEARANAQMLELLNDIHHADEKPPDNVLFVCKLNPVTQDDDLEIIFSRFGAIECCEVIRDKRTGASLQYAFIEFKNPKDCESAYLKMDNVLIDDRRIHVDFSQSVAKNFQWKKQVYGDEKPRKTMKGDKGNRRDRPRDDRRDRDRDSRRRRSRSKSPKRRHSPDRRRRSKSPPRRHRDRPRSPPSKYRRRGSPARRSPSPHRRRR
uniref:Peptidyl-prolyl cis-trans isomerase n=1 Tax=Steinernema glaseri TaxID=37863 RepID=A0A1I8AHA7_9BILA